MEVQAVSAWLVREGGTGDVDILLGAATRVAPEAARRYLRGDLELEDAASFLAALIRGFGCSRLMRRLGIDGLRFVLSRLVRAVYWYAFRYGESRRPRA